MTDVAALGMSVKATGVAEAAKALDGLTMSASKAESAATGLATASGKTAPGLSAAAEAAKKAKAENDNLARSVAMLRAEFNPMLAAADRYKTSLEAISRAEAAGAISTREAGNYRTLAAQAAEKHAAALGNVTGAAKLTSNQFLNLTRQGGDTITMFALGAPVMQIFASQAAQVVDALQSGPRGLTGSLKAVGEGIASLITPGRLAVVGLTAIAGAAVYYGVQGIRSIRPLNEALEDHRKMIADVAKSYGAAIAAQDAYATGSAREFGLRRSSDELRLSARTSLLDSGFAGGGDMTRVGRTDDGGREYRAARGLEAFEAPLIKLAEGLRTGTDDARAFVDEIARIANADPGNRDLQDKAKKLADLARPAAEAAQQIKALATSLDQMRMTRIGDATNAFKGFLPDTLSERDRIRQGNAARVAAIGELSGGNRGLAESMRVAASNDLARALAEVARQEEVVRSGRALDLRALAAQSVAERAVIAAEQERLALSGQVLDASEREARISHASSMVLAQEAQRRAEELRQMAEDYGRTVAARSDGIRATVAEMQTELRTIGLSTSAAAALRFEFDHVTEAKRAAAQAGLIVGPEDLTQIREAAARVGELAAAIEDAQEQRNKFERIKGLAEEASAFRSGLFRSDGENAIAASLRACGVGAVEVSYP